SANATTPSLLQVKSVNKDKTAKPQPSQTEIDPQDRKKPSVVDAVHLKQDHKSADGSETAVKMKEDVRLNDVRKVPPKVEVEKPPPAPAIEVGGQNKPVASPLNPPLLETSRLPPHSSQQVPSPSGNLSEDETAITDETGIFPPAVVQPRETTKNEDINLDLEAAEKTNLFNDPKCPSLPAVPTRKVSPKYFRLDKSPGLDSADVGIELAGDVKDGDAADRRCVVFRQIASSPNFAVLRSPQPVLPNSPNGLTPALSTYWAFNAEPTVWPKISWPRHFWLILAAFFFAGLETTYGAFVHTFTLRTLHWSPVRLLRKIFKH
ncbi:unnamed protein product, partial [Dibothriocephalus latus]